MKSVNTICNYPISGHQGHVGDAGDTRQNKIKNSSKQSTITVTQTMFK